MSSETTAQKEQLDTNKSFTVFDVSTPMDTFLEETRTWLFEVAKQFKCQKEDLHAVFYTDGGCRPTSRGVGGWGIHGFVYTDDVPKQGHGCSGFFPSPVGYVDKAREDKAKVTVLKYLDATGSLIPESTNNQAEVEGLRRALLLATSLKLKRLHLILDSEYALKGATQWLPKWLACNFVRQDGSEYANVELWKSVAKLLDLCKEQQIEMTWEWNRGHSDSIGNNAADTSATRGTIVGRKGIALVDVKFQDIKGYWNPDIEHNRFLSEGRWYFRSGDLTSHITPDGKYVYHVGNHGPDDDTHGKKISDTNYAVVHLSQPDPALETIRELQASPGVAGMENSVVIGRLDTIMLPKVYRDLCHNKSLFVHREGITADLFTAEDLSITREQRPTRRAYHAEEYLMLLETVLQEFIKGDKPDCYVVTDITDVIYETDTSKKKPVRKIKLPVDASTLAVVVNYNTDGAAKTSSLTLTVGLDTPKRNTLSALSEEASVFVVTWKESASAFRYATVLKTERDIGIWAGVYSNLRIVTS